MTADLTPFVVGKVLEQADPIKAVRVERADGQWQSEPTACQADGTFAIMVSLLARQSSVFRLSGVLANGGHVDLQPSEFRISHGLTIGEPPLARSIGVALADNQVMRYFECGAALPIRRTFTLRTVETVHPQDTSYALKVPIVQGEFSLAHLCRLVGTLEIPGSSLNAALPVGSEIELMLELDRGGQLRARGRIVCTDQIFDQVAVLITPQISLDEAEAALERLVERAESLSRTAFRDRSSADANRLSGIFSRFEEIRQNLSAVRGSDFDAGEQVRRALTEVDGILADAEAEKAWPELMENLEGEFPGYLAWVAQYGGDQEMSSLTRAYHACRQAIADKQEQEAERQFSVIRQIGSGAYLRSPGAWAQQFDKAAARADESTDLRRAAELVSRGKVARQQNNQFELEKIVQELWGLQPVESQTRVLGHGSGLITL
jgi:molecular chaperone DnaK